MIWTGDRKADWRLVRETWAVTMEQTLVGAMGLASWAARSRLLEYADAATAGGLIKVVRGVPTRAGVGPTTLSEVGVTDAVMATIWATGPTRAAYAVSAAAEAGHLGADIAIVHMATRRVLLYQAKLARLDMKRDLFRLKSTLTVDQRAKLGEREVDLDGDRYMVTGRLAIYQVDHTCCIDGCDDPDLAWWRHRLDWPTSPRRRPFGPWTGTTYYTDVLLRHRCSPSGILAAGATFRSRVPVGSTWPWEFETFGWLRGTNDGPIFKDGSTADPPLFDAYADQQLRPRDIQLATQLASRLATALGPSRRKLLHVVLL